VKNLDDRDLEGVRSVDQRSQAPNKKRYVGVAPVWAMTKRLLHVNDNQRGFRRGHWTASHLVSIVAIPGSVGKTQIGPLSDKKRHCDGEAPKRVWQPESAIPATEVSLPEILNSFRRIIS